MTSKYLPAILEPNAGRLYTPDAATLHSSHLERR